STLLPYFARLSEAPTTANAAPSRKASIFDVAMRGSPLRACALPFLPDHSTPFRPSLRSSCKCRTSFRADFSYYSGTRRPKIVSGLIDECRRTGKIRKDWSVLHPRGFTVATQLGSFLSCAFLCFCRPAIAG